MMFEYMGGVLPSKIFEKMPFGSEMIICGCLTNEPVPIDSANTLS